MSQDTAYLVRCSCYNQYKMYMEVQKMNRKWRSVHRILIVLMMLCFVQCKDSNDDEPSLDFDPSKPVTVDHFLPEEGGAGSNLVIYGDNFGNDLSRIRVVIGGKDAKVIGVKSSTLYCIIPTGAVEGDIQVYVLDEEGADLAHAEAKEIFVYDRKWLVSDLVGKYYEVGSDFEEKEGPFEDCGAFKNIAWFSFDPENPDHLYFSADASSARMVDLKKEYVSYFRHGFSRVYAISWMLGGDRDMIVSDNHAVDTRVSHHIFSRSSNFTQKTPIPVNARGVASTMVHPKNGELYYSLFRAGQVRRYDFDTKEDVLAFPNPYSAVTTLMMVHPSGDYAYITNFEQHYIMRSDYDYERKTFKTPYPVAGSAGNGDYKDGVGTNARLNRPFQGVFVKNPDYAGQDDEYDYYFCDKNNHAIRRLTPLGRVSTFAGRGNNGDSGYANGEVRTEARFNAPNAIAYDEARECFYVGDTDNWIIRKIAQETGDEEVIDDGNGNEGGDEDGGGDVDVDGGEQ